MAMNQRCPRCGSMRVQLSDVDRPHGCLWFLLLGVFYLLFLFCKWCIGFLILVYFDWWMAIIRKARGVGYVWKCTRWFTGWKKTYYCHDCYYNFKG